MLLRLLIFCLIFSSKIFVFGQTDTIIVQPDIHLPKDSFVSSRFISSLNNFLSLKDKANDENTLVWANESLETDILLDEMKGVEKNRKLKDDKFYKPYLTNVVKLSDSTYLVQISYIGMNGNTPTLRASYTLVAHWLNSRFYFASPLRRSTKNWQSKKIGNYTFFYKTMLNDKVAIEYKKTIALFDKKLKAPEQEAEIFCCDDFPEVLSLVGVDYNSIYNGYNANNELDAQTTSKKILVNASVGGGFNYFDPHDLWHARLHRVVSIDIINKPVDEGCAFLYGGSWGMTWEEIKNKFYQKFPEKQNTDFLELYQTEYNFGESELKRLRMDYFINALIVQKIEREQGFNSVLKLLTCGKYEKDNLNYFNELEQLTGINKSNFNIKIRELVYSKKM